MPTLKETAQELFALTHNPHLAPQIKDQHLSALAKPKQLPGADLAFIDKTTQKPTTVDLFGQQVTGIKVDPSLPPEKNGQIDKNGVVQLTPNRLKQWGGFYESVYDGDLVDKYGKKALELHGLDTMQPDEVEELTKATSNLLHSQQWRLQEQGVFDVVPRPDLGLDFAFVDRKGKLKPAKLAQVREAKLEGEIMVKNISLEPKPVAGIILPLPYETQREYNDRINAWNNDHPGMVVPLHTEGQARVWRKLGTEELSADVQSVLGVTFFGGGTNDPGILAAGESGLSLPTVSGRDFIELKKDDKPANLDNVIGVDLNKLKKGVIDFRPVDNVSALIPAFGKSPEEMKQLAKTYQHTAQRSAIGNPTGIPLFVTEELLAKWKNDGIFFPVPEREDILAKDPLEKKVQYGYGISNPTEASFNMPWRGGMVGGADYDISIKNEAGQTVRIKLDMGSLYEGLPSQQMSLTGKPSAVNALRVSLATGASAMKPGLYSEAALLSAANEECWPELFYKSQDPATTFVQAELLKRTEDRLHESLSSENILRLKDAARSAIEKWYPDNIEEEWAAILIGHAHKDHIGNTGPATINAPMILSPDTAALAQYISDRSDVANKITTVAYPHLGLQGGKYYAENRPIIQIRDAYKEFRIDKNISAVFCPVDHSIPGAVSIIVKTRDFKTVFYTGDWKSGPNTDASIPHIASYKPDLIICESTNPPDTNKASAKVTRQEAMGNLKREIRDPKVQNKLVIIVASPNNVERLSDIIEISPKNRKVVVNYAAADALQHLSYSRQTNPANSMFFETKIPELGPDCLVYMKPGKRKLSWQQAILDNIGGDYVTLTDLWKNPGSYILVLSPYDVLDNYIGGCDWTNKITEIYSAPFPYGWEDKQRVGNTVFTLKRWGAELLSDFVVYGLGGRISHGDNPKYRFHSGGHTTGKENFDYLSQIISGRGEDHKNVEIVFVHGEHTKAYSDLAKMEFAARGLYPKILTGFNRYDPKDPINRPGHSIPLY